MLTRTTTAGSRVRHAERGVGTVVEVRNVGDRRGHDQRFGAGDVAQLLVRFDDGIAYANALQLENVDDEPDAA